MSLFANVGNEVQMEKISSLEAKLRRVTAILGDALRAGAYEDRHGYRSLETRVKEDAPDALDHLQQLPCSLTGLSHCKQHNAQLPTKETSALREVRADQVPLVSAVHKNNPITATSSTEPDIVTLQATSLGTAASDRVAGGEYLFLPENGTNSAWNYNSSALRPELFIADHMGDSFDAFIDSSHPSSGYC